MKLTQDQINRYSRHLLLPEVGVEGQAKICSAKVLCIGTGALGSPVSLYLAAAGYIACAAVDTAILYGVTQSELWRYQVEKVALGSTIVIAVIIT